MNAVYSSKELNFTLQIVKKELLELIGFEKKAKFFF